MVHPLITLYSPTEIEFTTNGLGSLGEATSCIVTEEANGGFELEMTYPVSGKRYKDIVNRSIIFAKPNPIDQAQPFRVYEISRPMNGLVKFYAAHISYDLSGYPVKPFTAGSAAATMAGLKSNSIVQHPFTFWTDKSVESTFTLEAPSSTRGILAGVQGSVLDVYAGEYKFDRFQVRLYTHRGSNRGVVIRYGKNMTDMTQDENCSKVYTGVYPYWRGEGGVLVQLPEGYVKTSGTYNFINIYTLDLTEEYETEPTLEQLREKAEAYIKNNNVGVPDVSLKVSFAQLEQTEEYKHLALFERVELFDTVTVDFPKMNVSSTAKIVQTVYDVLMGKYKSVTVGNVRSNISDTIINQNATISQATSRFASAAERATSWITNGKGYMVMIKDENGNLKEICSLDKPNLVEATKVWRWNNGGFGFSNNGYNGDYGNNIALTADGAINASMITTGELNANVITAGVIKDKKNYNSWDLDAGMLNAQNIRALGSFRCGESYENGYYILLEDTEFQGWRNGRKVGYINFSASMFDFDLETYRYGLQMQAEGVVRISSPVISVCPYSDIMRNSIHAITKKISQPIITKIEDNGDGSITYHSGVQQLHFVNGLLVNYSIPDGSVSDFTQSDFPLYNPNE